MKEYASSLKTLTLPDSRYLCLKALNHLFFLLEISISSIYWYSIVSYNQIRFKYGSIIVQNRLTTVNKLYNQKNNFTEDYIQHRTKLEVREVARLAGLSGHNSYRRLDIFISKALFISIEIRPVTHDYTVYNIRPQAGLKLLSSDSYGFNFLSNPMLKIGFRF